jgi:alkylated DNA nucleotide flippase Atl1
MNIVIECKSWTPPANEGRATPFECRVWNVLRTVRVGGVVTYVALARRVGRPMQSAQLRTPARKVQSPLRSPVTGLFEPAARLHCQSKNRSSAREVAPRSGTVFGGG